MERTGRVRRGASAARELGRRQHVGAWLVVTVVVALLLALMAATGQFGRGRPYYGKQVELGETVELDRWTVSVDRLWLERQFGTDEKFMLAMHLQNDGPETSYGPINQLIAVIWNDELLYFSDCNTAPVASNFQPGIMSRALCTVSVSNEGLIIVPGDFRAKVILFSEQPDQEPGLGDRWRPTKPAFYVETEVKDKRERE